MYADIRESQNATCDSVGENCECRLAELKDDRMPYAGHDENGHLRQDVLVLLKRKTLNQYIEGKIRVKTRSPETCKK